jgi:polar amino acid transport system permease protein
MRADKFYEDGDISQIELDRRAFRKKQTFKSLLISIVSLIVFATFIYLTVGRSEGWARVQVTYFSPEKFIQALPKVAKGFLFNLEVLGITVPCVAILATLLAITRATKSAVMFPLRMLATAYTDIFRGLPMIIVLYLIGFGVPALGFFGRIPMLVLGTIAVALVYTAYVAEVLRAGIEAIHPSQRMAARSLGFSYQRTMGTIILPQAVRKVTPALMNDFVAMQKDVGLISIIGGVDAVRSAGIVNAINFNYTPYICAGVLFILLATPFIHLTDWYSRKRQKQEQLQGSV